VKNPARFSSKSAEMATQLTASLCLLLRNCIKRIKQDFLDTAFNRKPSLTTWQFLQNTDFLDWKQSEKQQLRFITEDRGTPKARGRSNCYICYYRQSGTGWRIFQIWRLSWMLPRATENTVAGHMWPAGIYLPTPALWYIRRRIIAKGWSEWRWTFSFSCVENWLLLRSL